MYVLPALPAAEEKDKSSSEEEEEEKEREEMDDSYHMYQGELYDDPNSVDINSEEFACLPPEMKHEILKDMKEFSKRRRTMYHKPPERNKLNQRLVGLEKEMSQQSAGNAPQLYEQDGEQQSHSVESQRLALKRRTRLLPRVNWQPLRGLVASFRAAKDDRQADPSPCGALFVRKRRKRMLRPLKTPNPLS
ncbi:DNA repair protein complementing XP-G cells-like protein [Larimichthys crocea]|uniref:Uncharacterized protein n=1 Tax=Larimichthys crocea TaxID=215358 RepID=A0ACD3R1F2_LARCR|nr:DNA repair protein complementing XP-G cells-like protein [Larimichthys crocea]